MDPTREKICLASDNFTADHPLVVQAVVEANEGYASPYGGDLWTEEAQKLIQEVFGRKCKVFFVPTGTGANIFALKLSCDSHESVICTDTAHIHTLECGSPESIVGCKLLIVPHQEGKLNPEMVLKELGRERAFGKLSTSPPGSVRYTTHGSRDPLQS